MDDLKMYAPNRKSLQLANTLALQLDLTSAQSKRVKEKSDGTASSSAELTKVATTNVLALSPVVLRCTLSPSTTFLRPTAILPPISGRTCGR